MVPHVPDYRFPIFRNCGFTAQEYSNPTVGLLVCRNMDRVEAQYALESSSQPIGVSGYQLSKLIPDEFKGSLPTIEEIESELNDVGK